jgi:hypothetical protein
MGYLNDRDMYAFHDMHGMPAMDAVGYEPNDDLSLDLGLSYHGD